MGRKEGLIELNEACCFKTNLKRKHMIMNNPPNINKYNSENDENENRQITVFKALIRETSVYKYYVELKDGALTTRGFLDLIKVPKLYVYTGNFLRTLRLQKNLSQNSAAKIIDRDGREIDNWEKNRRRMPLRLLIMFAEAFNLSKDKIYELIDQGEISLKNKIPIKFEKIKDIVRYLIPMNNRRSYITKCSKATLNRIGSILNLKIAYTTKEAKIASQDLCRILLRFFQYTKIPKINFPLTDEVKHWHKKGLDLKKAIIIPALQSDGSIDKRYHAINYNGLNVSLHDYFVDAMFYEYGILPSSYFVLGTNGRNYITRYNRKSVVPIVSEILNMAGNVKTKSAVGQSVDKYLRESQPHLRYLFNALQEERQIAVRFWASAEGCISVVRKGCVYPILEIACSHPDLCAQLKRITESCGINFNVYKKEKTWSGIGGLYHTSTKNTINFLRINGFIRDVKISSVSKYHQGISKNILLLGILEYKKRELENRHLKKLPIKEVHQYINKIIANKEYKTQHYYIKYFSKDDISS